MCGGPCISMYCGAWFMVAVLRVYEPPGRRLCSSQDQLRSNESARCELHRRVLQGRGLRCRCRCELSERGIWGGAHRLGPLYPPKYLRVSSSVVSGGGYCVCGSIQREDTGAFSDCSVCRAHDRARLILRMHSVNLQLRFEQDLSLCR